MRLLVFGDYLHAVSLDTLDQSTIIIPNGITKIAKNAFMMFDSSKTHKVKRIVFPSTFKDDIYLETFSKLRELESIEINSDRVVSIYFDDRKRFKIAEFQKKFLFANAKK